MQEPCKELRQADSDAGLLCSSTLGGLHILSLDMIVHECHVFYAACAELTDAADWLASPEVTPSDRLVTADDLIYVKQAAELLDKAICELGITKGGFAQDCRDVINHVRSLYGGVWKGVFDVRADFLARDYRRVRDGLLQELHKHKFLYLPSHGVEYFAQDQLFGEAVFDHFPSARYEIKEGGNALSFEMYTAAVFHFMRAAEVALRALARDRRISKLPKKRDAPIEMGTWEDIIKELDDQVAKICNWPNVLGEIKTQALEFYNGSLMEYRGFKGKWRNHVMHTRREYLRNDALSAMEHVKRLMQSLADRISETRHTPPIWTKSQLR